MSKENRGLTLPLPERLTNGHGYLWDEQLNMVVDAGCDDEGLLRARGWGYLTGTGGLNLTTDEAATYQDRLLARAAEAWNAYGQPIPMILHCPQCGTQHVDAPEPENGWANPPHKSHLCRPQDGGCGTIWRPAEVPTNGVASIETRGDRDTWPTGAQTSDTPK